METNLPKNEDSQTNDFFDSLQVNGHDQQVIQPPGAWQKFWHNSRLRVAVGIVIILVIIGAAAGYFLYSWQASSLVMTDYVPGSAWLYLEFNFNAQQWQQLQDQTPQLTQQINDFFITQGLSQELINLSSQIALVGSLEDGELAWTWLLKTNQPRQLEVFIEPGTFLRQPGTQVAVISTDPRAVKRFNYWPGREPVYPPAASLWFGYVLPSEFAEYFDDNSERSISRPLIRQRLQQFNRPLPLSVVNQQGFLQLSIGDLNNSAVVWPEFVSDYDLVLKNINLSKAITDLETAVSGLPLAQYIWQSVKEESAANFALNWHTLQEKLNQPVNLAVTSQLGLDTYETIDDLPRTLNEYEIIINLADSSEETVRFASESIRHYMAYRFPSQVKRNLPDGSLAYDLIVDFDQQSFVQDQSTRGWQTISSPDASLGYTIWLAGNNLTIANQGQISSLRLSDLHEFNFTCGDIAGEQLYIDRGLLNFFPLTQGLNEMMITTSVAGLGICLR